MWLFDLFKSEKQLLEEKIVKVYEKAAKNAIRESSGNSIMEGVLIMYALSVANKNLRESIIHQDMREVHRSDLLDMIDRALHSVGRKYIRNWDDMIRSKEDDYDDPLEYMDFYDDSMQIDF